MSDERRPERSGESQVRSEGRAGGADGGGDQDDQQACPTNVGPSGAVEHRM